VRIIAGEFRGRKLLPPDGQQTRPITDRVKQSLFDILVSQITGAVVYDCFAGTGSLGLESISRGASRAVFFERDRPALQRLRQNIEALGVRARATVISTDVFRYLEDDPGGPDAGRADIIFLDPPYGVVVEEPDKLRALARRLADAHLSPGGLVIFRHDARDRLELPELVRYDERTYGGMTLEFLRRP
jgi:16S rRNA (guanine966-N2)-methyltransferase